MTCLANAIGVPIRVGFSASIADGQFCGVDFLQNGSFPLFRLVTVDTDLALGSLVQERFQYGKGDAENLWRCNQKKVVI